MNIWSIFHSQKKRYEWAGRLWKKRVSVCVSVCVSCKNENLYTSFKLKKKQVNQKFKKKQNFLKEIHFNKFFLKYYQNSIKFLLKTFSKLKPDSLKSPCLILKTHSLIGEGHCSNTLDKHETFRAVNCFGKGNKIYMN